MKKVILSSLIAFAFASGAFSQGAELSKWSAGVKGGLSLLRGVYYGTENSDRFDRPYNPEFGVFVERTSNPLIGYGLEYMYQGNNADGNIWGKGDKKFDASVNQVTVYSSINMSNLLNRFRTSTKFNTYFNTGIGAGIASYDDKAGTSESGILSLAASFGLNFEYNLTPYLAIGAEGVYRWNSNSDYIPVDYRSAKDFMTADINVRYKFNGVTNNRNTSIVEFERINSQKDATQQAIDKIQYELARQAEDIKKLQERGSNDSIDGVAIKDIIIGQQYQMEQLAKQLTKARKDLYRHLANSNDGLTGDSTQYDISAVGFKTGSAKLTPAAYSALDTIVPQIVQNDKWTIKVLGHTDNVGGEAINKSLSLKRAEAVKAYLVKKGVKAPRITAQGLASTKPVACNDTEEGRAKNRRVEVIVNK